MDVRCPHCDTLYEIDPEQMRGGGATFKCSQCDHVFRLQSHAALSQENQRRWMVRDTGSGDILYFSSFTQLHEWIMEGVASRDDEISRTGKKWTPLSDIGEFMPVFQAVDSISNISASRAAQEREKASQAPPEPNTAGSAPASEPRARPSSQPSATAQPASQESSRKRVPTSRQFAAEHNTDAGAGSPGTDHDLAEASQPEPRGTPVDPQRSQTPPPRQEAPTGAREGGSQQSGSQPEVRLQSGAFGAAAPEDSDEWSFGDGTGRSEVDSSAAVRPEAASSSRWPIVLGLVVVLAAGGAAAVYFLRPDLVEPWLGTQPAKEVVDIAKDPEGPKAGGAQQAEVDPREPLDEAIGAALLAASQRNGRHFDAIVAQAHSALVAGIDKATRAAKKAAEEPDPDELLRKARSYLEGGRPKRARAKFHKVLEVDRANVEAITGLGWSLLAMGSPSAASAQFRKALNFDGSHGDAYIGLGKAEREQGNTSGALKAYQDYLSRFPSGPKASIARYQADKLEQSLGQ